MSDTLIQIAMAALVVPDQGERWATRRSIPNAIGLATTPADLAHPALRHRPRSGPGMGHRSSAAIPGSGIHADEPTYMR